MVCVNKYDLNPEKAREIEEFAIDKGVTFLGYIPFDPIFTKAMVQGQNVFEYNTKSEACWAVGEIWEKISTTLEINK